MNVYISLNIKYLCLKNNLQYNEFATIVDAGKSVVSMWASGKSSPKIEAIQKICAHFEITIDDFINKDLSKIEKPLNKTAIENEMLSQMEAMEPGSFYGASFLIETLQKQLSDKDTIIELKNKEIERLKGTSNNNASKIA